MDGIYAEIVLHVQIVFEASADGHKQAKFVRLPERPTGDFKVQTIPFPAYQLNKRGEKDFKAIVKVWLYWPSEVNDTNVLRKISGYLPKYIERLIASDENLRALISEQLPGEGWHFPEESLWKP